MKNTYFFFLAITFIVTSSCAPFSNKITRDHSKKLTPQNMKLIEGTYEIACYDSYFKARSGNEIIQFKKHHGRNTVNELVGSYAIDTTLLKKLVVDVALLPNRELKFTYRDQDAIIGTTIVEMKLRRNGMLHLKNRETKITGIPLVLGSIEINRSRIGISENNDLLIHNIYHITGGFLILLGDSRNHNTTYYFKRIKNASS